ncbi:hypothetical protein CYMTET_42287 [Cymbomonas tetramitiformis]|uniref:Uncharacterized protein n=1 Tax=Cymbomonas tetramitiformis TaxID=36881 RepID=A0AAE0F1T6_9CHLO|nr:hypothetical protein CYMTET_42287 [Cymbomonas tetramitiformis]
MEVDDEYEYDDDFEIDEEIVSEIAAEELSTSRPSSQQDLPQEFHDTLSSRQNATTVSSGVGSTSILAEENPVANERLDGVTAVGAARKLSPPHTPQVDGADDAIGRSTDDKSHVAMDTGHHEHRAPPSNLELSSEHAPKVSQQADATLGEDFASRQRTPVGDTEGESPEHQSGLGLEVTDLNDKQRGSEFSQLRESQAVAGGEDAETDYGEDYEDDFDFDDDDLVLPDDTPTVAHVSGGQDEAAGGVTEPPREPSVSATTDLDSAQPREASDIARADTQADVGTLGVDIESKKHETAEVHAAAEPDGLMTVMPQVEETAEVDADFDRNSVESEAPRGKVTETATEAQRGEGPVELDTTEVGLEDMGEELVEGATTDVELKLEPERSSQMGEEPLETDITEVDPKMEGGTGKKATADVELEVEPVMVFQTGEELLEADNTEIDLKLQGQIGTEPLEADAQMEGMPRESEKLVGEREAPRLQQTVSELQMEAPMGWDAPENEQEDFGADFGPTAETIVPVDCDPPAGQMNYVDPTAKAPAPEPRGGAADDVEAVTTAPVPESQGGAADDVEAVATAPVPESQGGAADDVEAVATAQCSQGGAADDVEAVATAPVPESQGGAADDVETVATAPVPESQGGADDVDVVATAPVPESQGGGADDVETVATASGPESQGGGADDVETVATAPVPESQGGAADDLDAAATDLAPENQGGAADDVDVMSTAPVPESQGRGADDVETVATAPAPENQGGGADGVETVATAPVPESQLPAPENQGGGADDVEAVATAPVPESQGGAADDVDTVATAAVPELGGADDIGCKAKMVPRLAMEKIEADSTVPQVPGKGQLQTGTAAGTDRQLAPKSGVTSVTATPRAFVEEFGVGVMRAERVAAPNIPRTGLMDMETGHAECDETFEEGLGRADGGAGASGAAAEPGATSAEYPSAEMYGPVPKWWNSQRALSDRTHGGNAAGLEAAQTDSTTELPSGQGEAGDAPRGTLESEAATTAVPGKGGDHPSSSLPEETPRYYEDDFEDAEGEDDAELLEAFQKYMAESPELVLTARVADQAAAAQGALSVYNPELAAALSGVDVVRPADSAAAPRSNRVGEMLKAGDSRVGGVEAGAHSQPDAKPYQKVPWQQRLAQMAAFYGRPPGWHLHREGLLKHLQLSDRQVWEDRMEEAQDVLRKSMKRMDGDLPPVEAPTAPPNGLSDQSAASAHATSPTDSVGSDSVDQALQRFLKAYKQAAQGVPPLEVKKPLAHGGRRVVRHGLRKVDSRSGSPGIPTEVGVFYMDQVGVPSPPKDAPPEGAPSPRRRKGGDAVPGEAQRSGVRRRLQMTSTDAPSTMIPLNSEPQRQLAPRGPPLDATAAAMDALPRKAHVEARPAPKVPPLPISTALEPSGSAHVVPEDNLPAGPAEAYQSYPHQMGAADMGFDENGASIPSAPPPRPGEQSPSKRIRPQRRTAASAQAPQAGTAESPREPSLELGGPLPMPPAPMEAKPALADDASNEERPGHVESQSIPRTHAPDPPAPPGPSLPPLPASDTGLYKRRRPARNADPKGPLNTSGELAASQRLRGDEDRKVGASRQPLNQVVVEGGAASAAQAKGGPEAGQSSSHQAGVKGGDTLQIFESGQSGEAGGGGLSGRLSVDDAAYLRKATMATVASGKEDERTGEVASAVEGRSKVGEADARSGNRLPGGGGAEGGLVRSSLEDDDAEIALRAYKDAATMEARLAEAEEEETLKAASDAMELEAQQQRQAEEERALYLPEEPEEDDEVLRASVTTSPKEPEEVLEGSAEGDPARLQLAVVGSGSPTGQDKGWSSSLEVGLREQLQVVEALPTPQFEDNVWQAQEDTMSLEEQLVAMSGAAAEVEVEIQEAELHYEKCQTEAEEAKLRIQSMGAARETAMTQLKLVELEQNRNAQLLEDDARRLARMADAAEQVSHEADTALARAADAATQASERWGEAQAALKQVEGPHVTRPARASGGGTAGDTWGLEAMQRSQQLASTLSELSRIAARAEQSFEACQRAAAEKAALAKQRKQMMREARLRAGAMQTEARKAAAARDKLVVAAERQLADAQKDLAAAHGGAKSTQQQIAAAAVHCERLAAVSTQRRGACVALRSACSAAVAKTESASEEVLALAQSELAAAALEVSKDASQSQVAAMAAEGEVNQAKKTEQLAYAYMQIGAKKVEEARAEFKNLLDQLKNANYKGARLQLQSEQQNAKAVGEALQHAQRLRDADAETYKCTQEVLETRQRIKADAAIVSKHCRQVTSEARGKVEQMRVRYEQASSAATEAAYIVRQLRMDSVEACSRPAWQAMMQTATGTMSAAEKKKQSAARELSSTQNAAGAAEEALEAAEEHEASMLREMDEAAKVSHAAHAALRGPTARLELLQQREVEASRRVAAAEQFLIQAQVDLQSGVQEAAQRQEAAEGALARATAKWEGQAAVLKAAQQRAAKLRASARICEEQATRIRNSLALEHAAESRVLPQEVLEQVRWLINSKSQPLDAANVRQLAEMHGWSVLHTMQAAAQVLSEVRPPPPPPRFSRDQGNGAAKRQGQAMRAAGSLPQLPPPPPGRATEPLEERLKRTTVKAKPRVSRLKSSAQFLAPTGSGDPQCQNCAKLQFRRLCASCVRQHAARTSVFPAHRPLDGLPRKGLRLLQPEMSHLRPAYIIDEVN